MLSSSSLNISENFEKLTIEQYNILHEKEKIEYLETENSKLEEDIRLWKI